MKTLGGFSFLIALYNLHYKLYLDSLTCLKSTSAPGG
jgi:hypothetical protein